MFSKARVSLTRIYSIIFLSCFWIFSLGLFAWMEFSFIDEESNKFANPSLSENADAAWKGVVLDIHELALDRLEIALIVLNIVLLIVIPAVSWYLTGRALEPVRRSHEAQRQFVSDAAHELRTPLTIIQSEIEVALHQSRQSDDYRSALTSNLHEVKRLSELVERLLFLAKHDDGIHTLLDKQIDLTDLLSTVLALHRVPLEEKQILLEFNPAEDSVTVLGDETMLAMMFGNLIDNAIKYSGTGGRIAVTIRSRMPNVEVQIVDTGIGIASELHEKIFDRFTRADISRGQSKGHGLGLSICNAIANRHQGAVSVTSTPGHGSTFTVVLPLA